MTLQQENYNRAIGRPDFNTGLSEEQRRLNRALERAIRREEQDKEFRRSLQEAERRDWASEMTEAMSRAHADLEAHLQNPGPEMRSAFQLKRRQTELETGKFAERFKRVVRDRCQKETGRQVDVEVVRTKMGGVLVHATRVFWHDTPGDLVSQYVMEDSILEQTNLSCTALAMSAADDCVASMREALGQGGHKVDSLYEKLTAEGLSPRKEPQEEESTPEDGEYAGIMAWLPRPPGAEKKPLTKADFEAIPAPCRREFAKEEPYTVDNEGHKKYLAALELQPDAAGRYGWDRVVKAMVSDGLSLDEAKRTAKYLQLYLTAR